MSAMVYVIGYLIGGIICGAICVAIASGRGMSGGFWWGFFLGIIGIIVVAVMPNDKPVQQTSSYYNGNPSSCSIGNSIDKRNREEDILASGGWRCNNCGKVNFGYTYGCDCGARKGDPVPPKPLKSTVINEDSEENPQSVAEEIRKFKQLADDGIITEQEFEKKKKQLLGL